MIRHVLMIRWKPSFTDEIREKWITGLNKLEGEIPELIKLTHGKDVLGKENSWDHVLIADFENVEDIERYNVHPSHEAIKQYSLPNAAELAYVDFEVPAPESH